MLASASIPGWCVILCLVACCYRQQLAIDRIGERVAILEAASSRSAAAASRTAFAAVDLAPSADALAPQSQVSIPLTPDMIVSNIPTPSGHLRALSESTSDAPRATLRVDAQDDSSGVSELIFGEDGTADRVAFQHDMSTRSFSLQHNDSTILAVGPAGDTTLASTSSLRLRSPEVVFENNKAYVLTMIDQAEPVWDAPAISIQVGDSVTWSWSASYQNVVQANSEYAAIVDEPGTFSSGLPTVGGEFTVKFDAAGTFYYKSQNSDSLTGWIRVRESKWGAGDLVVANNVTVGADAHIQGNVYVRGIQLSHYAGHFVVLVGDGGRASYTSSSYLPFKNWKVQVESLPGSLFNQSLGRVLIPPGVRWVEMTCFNYVAIQKLRKNGVAINVGGVFERLYSVGSGSYQYHSSWWDASTASWSAQYKAELTPVEVAEGDYLEIGTYSYSSTYTWTPDYAMWTVRMF
mmetsp:Transcript_2319/g.6561  ORF Transcript_2319/g.6561 Transcript_2319/m.6561 type:complete len:462 (+) Transcript_2319:124-1509(+)